MLQEFWSYFMTTGNIDTYLGFKAYEDEYKSHREIQQQPSHADEIG